MQYCIVMSRQTEIEEQTNRPKMALCIYHCIYDFFRIPLLLKKWIPEYRFAVRQHWGNFDETVLYCYT